MAGQDVSGVLDAKGALEEAFYEVAPRAEEHNNEAEAEPFEG